LDRHRRFVCLLVLLISTALPLLGRRATAGSSRPLSPNPQPLPLTASAEGTASTAADAFGYTLDDTVSFDWKGATGGNNSGLTGDDAFMGPIDVGFTFRFYENAYDRLYLSTNGLLSFDRGQTAYLNTSIPFPAEPNALIAALWADLCVRDGRNSGDVYYRRGGSAPNRFLVVEWHQISFQSNSAPLTFEVVLHENGDILLQYAVLSLQDTQATVGIEDMTGQDGLQFDASRLADGMAIRFRRPPAAARIQLSPTYQGQLAHPAQRISFTQTIRNTGEVGVDTFDLQLTSAWPVTLLDAQGVGLRDTNGNGQPDTGPVQTGSAISIAVLLDVPSGASQGDSNSVFLTAISSREPSHQKRSWMEACVPAGYAQILQDSSKDTVSVFLAQPWEVALREVYPPGRGAEGPAIAEAANGNLLCLWSRDRWNATAYTFEIEYALLDPRSPSAPSVRRLVDNSQATRETYDKQPALAAAADGQMGVVWVRKLFDSRFQENDNVYFALLNASGHLVGAPTNLTNSNSWGFYGEPGFVDISEPSIVALADGFAVAWKREVLVNEETVTDVFYTMCQPNGTLLGGIQRLTADTPGSEDGYSNPNLTAASDGRALLTWSRQGDGDIYYAVLSSSGAVLRAPERLSVDGLDAIDRDSDACVLPDGRIVVAWTGEQSIRYAVLDHTFQRVVGPSSLQNPVATFGNDSVSVVAAGSQAVLTWKDAGQSYTPRLYYALVDGDGRVLTPPIGFYHSSSPVVQTNSSGYSNTSYRAPSPTATQTPTATPSPTNTRTPTATRTAFPTLTLTPSPVRTETPSATPARISVYLPTLLKPPVITN